MTDQKRPLKVFLCHAHADRDSVRALYTRLTNDGVDAWLDKEKLLGGQNWRMEIRTAVEEADVVVVCHSKEFKKEGFRQREVRWALDAAMEKPEGTIFIIPARLEECEVIKSLSDWHWVDLFESNGYDMLMRALRARANNIGATLQIKRSWLPKITSPLSKQHRPIEIKTTETSENRVLNTTDDMPPPEFPDGWDNERTPAIETEEAHFVEKPHNKTNNLFVISKNRNLYISAGILFIVLILASVFGLPPLFNGLESNLTATEITPFLSTSTETPKPSATQTSTITPSPTMGVGSTMTGVDGMTLLYVPAGNFKMGSSERSQLTELSSDNYPQYDYYLDSFWIDQAEVTNQQYAMCVSDGKCQPPLVLNSPRRSSYYNDPKYDDFPVIYIEWGMARAYCEWAGRRLLTEAEWEKAARGTDSRIYPWGNDEPIHNYFLNYGTYWEDTSVVRSFSLGKSPYGVYDMAGNVWEWTSSLYMPYPYESDDGREDLLSTRERVLRGGSWYFNPDNNGMSIFRYGVISDPNYLVRSDVRSFASQDGRGPTSPEGLGIVGFRCAKDAP